MHSHETSWMLIIFCQGLRSRGLKENVFVYSAIFVRVEFQFVACNWFFDRLLRSAFKNWPTFAFTPAYILPQLETPHVCRCDLAANPEKQKSRRTTLEVVALFIYFLKLSILQFAFYIGGERNKPISSSAPWTHRLAFVITWLKCAIMTFSMTYRSQCRGIAGLSARTGHTGYESDICQFIYT